jgi:hypothetical protein
VKAGFPEMEAKFERALRATTVTMVATMLAGIGAAVGIVQLLS